VLDAIIGLLVNPALPKVERSLRRRVTGGSERAMELSVAAGFVAGLLDAWKTRS
jgi:hypothetical protein